MIILGIETSCDETSVAIVENGTKLISHTLASSQNIQAKYKGIVPDQAAREQLKSILPVLEEAIISSSLKISNIDALAVTVGPGLIGSLLIGVETAKTLSLCWGRPLIPVNHLIGHFYANWITEINPDITKTHSSDLPKKIPQFPALVLLVSGGHTELVLMHSHAKLEKLGGTLDDAAGECFDKCGRLLNLPYPYGPYLETEASKLTGDFNLKNILPRPMFNTEDYNFSFSGLKTAFVSKLKEMQINNQDQIAPYLAFALQEAVTDVLIEKTRRALLEFKPKSLLLAGGVAANKALRQKLSDILGYEIFKNRGEEVKPELYIPPIWLCTDNAVVTASCAFFQQKTKPIDQINAVSQLEVID